MPDIPLGAIEQGGRAVAEMFPGLGPETGRRIARAVLNAAAEPLGEFVAGKIGQHRDRYMTAYADGRAGTWRRYFGIAANVAASAFLTEDDKRRIAARELAADDFVACLSPEEDR